MTYKSVHQIAAQQPAEVLKEIVEYLQNENPCLVLEGSVYDPWDHTDLEDALEGTLYRLYSYDAERYGSLRKSSHYIVFHAELRMVELCDI